MRAQRARAQRTAHEPRAECHRRSSPRTQRELAATYEPTPKELAILEAHQHRRAAKPRSRVKVEKVAGKHQIRPDHPDVKIGSLLLMEALGTDSFDFLDGLLAQLTNAGSQGREPDQRGINFMLSVVQGIGPQDEVEAMLATQMAAVHMATMTFARRLAHVESIPQQDSAERAFNKLARTFTAQVEALKRYRTGGQQKVTVEHVHVHAGGQAIVGSDRAGQKRRGSQMPTSSPMHLSRRCGAKTRTGRPCRSPAMPNGRCRMHGGLSPGAPRGERNGNYRHGLFTREALAKRRDLLEFVKLMRNRAEKVK